MARFTRLEVLGALLEERLVPVFYHPDPKVCRDVALACARGGSRFFELTHRGDGAHRVFEDLLDFLKREAPRVILGVGSIRDAHTAALYLSLGANFVVGPILDTETARVCNGRKVAYLPGCGSATEIAQAEALGCEIVKLFPGDSVGGAELREGGAWAEPVDPDHAHRRRGGHAGQRSRLDRGRRGGGRDRLLPDPEGPRREGGLGRDRGHGPERPRLDRGVPAG